MVIQSQAVIKNETQNSYYKVITKCHRLLLQSASGITNCDKLLLQSASGITKCDSYHKVRRNTRDSRIDLSKKNHRNSYVQVA